MSLKQNESENKQEKTRLKRTLGLLETTVAGVGIILGVGIYALIGKAAGIAGNATWLSFVIGAVVAAFTALSYAELSSIFPKAGAEYVYTERTFGRRLAFLVGWLIVIGTMFASATVSLGFAGYFTHLFQLELPDMIIAAILIALLSIINVYGIKESTVLAIIATIIEALGLFIIIVIGLPHLGAVSYFEMPPGATNADLFSAAALLFFAFLGFESVTRLAEETKNPEKTIPAATLLSLGFSTIIYILVAFAAVSVIPWQHLAESSAPLADVAHVALGEATGIILTIIALFATANTALLMLVTDTRILYGMAESGVFPKSLKLAAVHAKRRTPWVAAVIVGILSIAFLAFEDIKILANATDFTVFITFIVINFAVVWIRYTQPDLHAPFRSPSLGKVPISAIVGAATSILLALNVGQEVIIGGIIIIISGIVLYEFVIKKIDGYQ
jgi:APA family basic amino acid/polyamine antiporter